MSAKKDIAEEEFEEAMANLYRKYPIAIGDTRERGADRLKRTIRAYLLQETRKAWLTGCKAGWDAATEAHESWVDSQFDGKKPTFADFEAMRKL